MDFGTPEDERWFCDRVKRYGVQHVCTVCGCLDTAHMYGKCTTEQCRCLAFSDPAKHHELREKLGDLRNMRWPMKPGDG